MKWARIVMAAAAAEDESPTVPSTPSKGKMAVKAVAAILVTAALLTYAGYARKGDFTIRQAAHLPIL